MKNFIKRSMFVIFISIMILSFTFIFSACSESNNNSDPIPEDAIQITNTTQLISAINNQQENQYWVLNAGTYDIDPAQTTITYNGERGWYLPVIEKGVTIRGIGNVILTSSIDSPNGSWASQNFITIVADDVTIRDITIVCKKEVNKSIEILGKNTTIKNIDFNSPEGYDFAGSIYLHQDIIPTNTEGDVGTLTLENVKLNKGRITATGANKGKIVFKNVKIDWTDIEEDCLSVYPMQNFNNTGKTFEYEGAETVEVKINANEIGANYDNVISNIIPNVKLVNTNDQ